MENREIHKSKIAVITSFFNPCNYENIKSNYIKFSNKIKKYADLFPIELSFDSNFFIQDPNCTRVNGNESNILWQKEALLNIALSKLPKEYEYVAWIDCDIIFNNTNWIKLLYQALSKYKVVQAFSIVNKLDINGNAQRSRCLVSSFPENGEAGFAWAFRREILDDIKLLDNQIFGGADYIMFSAFMNKPNIIQNLKRYINNQQTKEWIEKATSIVNESVGFIDTEITHLYHGSQFNRTYTRVLARDRLTNSIDVDKDVTKENGVWSMSSNHINGCKNYFISRHEDDNIRIKNFLDTEYDSHEDCLDAYIDGICDNIMSSHPSLILQIRDKMINSIQRYSQKHSMVYQQYPVDTVFTREQLKLDNNWLCDNIPTDRIMRQNTSGSTTGEPFRYCGDKKYFDFIQETSEFGLILKEYELYDRPIRLLNLFKHPFNIKPKPDEFYIETRNPTKSRFHTYGAKDVITFFVNWDGYMENPDEWHKRFLDFLSNNFFAIILCSGPVINILTRYIRKNNFNQKFANLLSHTTEFPRIEDFEFLKQNGNIDHYCDHMRCYDGGANFFTCKYGTYHLNDNLSWVKEGPENKLISTDYFNMVSPFVNYWNGDLCEIDENYRLCECGRYYRPFKMLENRPFALKGPTKLREIREQIKRLSFKNKINQIQFDNLTVNVYNNSELSTQQKNILNKILNDYEVKYYE